MSETGTQIDSITDPNKHSQALEHIRVENSEKFQANEELQNSMLYWYPPLAGLVADIPSVTTPETLFVHIDPVNAYELAQEDGGGELSDAELEAVMQCPAKWDPAHVQRAVDELGTPAFLRTDTDSHKHDINNAGRIGKRDIDHIDETIDALIRGVAGNSGMLGAPRFNCLAVREWINIDSSFTAFNGTPIGPEVRLFVENGEMNDAHCYWPFHTEQMQREIDGDYETVESDIEHIKTEINEAVDSHLRAAAEEISTHDAFTGEWSVDFALTVDDGWHVIDMARGEDSWRP